MTPDEWANVHASMALHEAQVVTAEVVGSKVLVESPYNPELVARINKFQPPMGYWRAAKKRWEFPADRLDEVKALYKDVYGEDGFTEVPRTVVRVDMDKAKAAGAPFSRENKSLWFLGKQLARTFGTKAPRTDKDVTVITGGFTNGGTGNMPTVEVEPGTVLLIDNIPQEPLFQLLAKLGPDSGFAVAGPTGAGSASAAPAASTAPAPAPPGSGASLADATGASAQPAAAAPVPSFTDLSGAQKARHAEIALMTKALAFRASQLPKELVEKRLASIGLSLKN